MKADILNEALFDRSFDTKSTEFWGRSIKREMSSTAMKLRYKFYKSTGDTFPKPQKSHFFTILKGEMEGVNICNLFG